MKSKPRKVLSTLLALVMMAGVIAVAPITVHAVAPDDPNGTAMWDFYSVTADGSGTGWDWDNTTQTLTLTNLSHSTNAATALRLPGGATIVLNGANTIASTYSSTGDAHGIFVGGAFTITGSGSLDVTSGGTDCSYGIYAAGSMTFSGAVAVNVTSGPADSTAGLFSSFSVIINDSAAVTAGHDPAGVISYAIYTGVGVTVNGGSLTVLATQSNSLFNKTYTVPSGYSYWFNSAMSATGATGPWKSSGSMTFYKASSTYQYVKIAAPVPPVITTASLPGGTVGTAYSQTLAATGDTPITWSATGLPGGLSINASTGVISGTPTAAGTFSVVVTANNGVAPNATKTLTLVVDPAPLSSTKDILTFSIPGQVGAASITGTAIAVTMPYGTNVTALVPTIGHNGASISPASGAAQNFTGPVTYTVTAADASTKTYTVTVTVAAPIAVNLAAIAGVTPPAYGAAPVTAITETAQYTGTVTWTPAPGAAFAASTAYTATITLTPKTGYTLTGVAANFFTVAGAAATNAANSGVITAAFPATGSQPATPYNVTVSGGTGGGSYLPGVTVNITAAPASSFFTGQVFKGWTASGVTLPTPGNASTSFIMPDSNVTVTAQYDTMIRLWGKTTTYKSDFLNWLLCIVCFGWLWMLFV